MGNKQSSSGSSAGPDPNGSVAQAVVVMTPHEDALAPGVAASLNKAYAGANASHIDTYSMGGRSYDYHAIQSKMAAATGVLVAFECSASAQWQVMMSLSTTARCTRAATPFFIVMAGADDKMRKFMREQVQRCRSMAKGGASGPAREVHMVEVAAGTVAGNNVDASWLAERLGLASPAPAAAGQAANADAAAAGQSAVQA